MEIDANVSKHLASEMLRHFRAQSEEEQGQLALLAGNSLFVLRMTQTAEPNTMVGQTLASIRDALTRGITDLPK